MRCSQAAVPLVKSTRLLNALPLGGVAAGPGASGPGPSALAALRPTPVWGSARSELRSREQFLRETGAVQGQVLLLTRKLWLLSLRARVSGGRWGSAGTSRVLWGG